MGTLAIQQLPDKWPQLSEPVLHIYLLFLQVSEAKFQRSQPLPSLP